MKLFDMNHSAFAPLWVRIAIVSAAAGWGVFEWWMGAPYWAAFFGCVALYAAWTLFVTFQPPAK